MKSIPVSSFKNHFAPQSSVYDRQVAKLAVTQKKILEEQQRKQQIKDEEELRETTFQPRINEVVFDQDFYSRQEYYQKKKEQKIQEMRNQQKKEQEFTFQPRINRTSEYILATRMHQQREPPKPSPNSDFTFQPEIGEFAKQLSFNEETYKRLYNTHGQYAVKAQQQTYESPPAIGNQQLLCERLHNYKAYYNAQHQKPTINFNATPDLILKRKNEQLLLSRRLRMATTTTKAPLAEPEYTFQPELNEVSKHLAINREPIVERLQTAQLEKEAKLQQLRMQKELKEIEECTFKPSINEFQGHQQDFMEKQQRLLDKRRNLEKELELKRIQKEEDEIRYVQEHCEGFKAKPIPDYGIKLFNNDSSQKKKIGEMLENGDGEMARELKRVGGGDLVVGSLAVDSVDKFVKRIREAKFMK
ncbi:Conserved_hypothetical protein [Hexamita inflata]|uniref:Uncharacterized protein n=1 Tax=Hexamita inflata TaxID=28002 RepID=A0AA86U0K3_9EUKA|nr:Conserved hypothetical protein [Hexamita inflata]CAI9949644.1 Conserved hypothetical protein [Hexamita inflata]